MTIEKLNDMQEKYSEIRKLQELVTLMENHGVKLQYGFAGYKADKTISDVVKAYYKGILEAKQKEFEKL